MPRCSLEGHGGAMYTHHPPEDRPDYLADQEAQDCDLLPGGKCVGDVGFMIGDTLFDALVEGGEQALVTEMLSVYRGTMEDDG